MTRAQGISGTGLAATLAGSLLLWSALQGREWSAVLRELIAGQQPGTETDYPITGGTVGTGGAGGTATGWETARASSFTGLQTASGRPMSPDTIASPYLPLGTRLDIEYKGKTVSGTVWDFGPADWVMAADPTRFLDLSTALMSRLTGRSSNLIDVKYRVTHYGTGRIYRPGAVKTAELRKRWG